MVLNRKYKGNTLPEVLIAIVIISFTSALGITIYLNIQQNTQPFRILKARELTQKYLRESLQKKTYFDNSYKEEEFTVKKVMLRSNDYPDCVWLKVAVFIQDKKISEVQKLVHAP